VIILVVVIIIIIIIKYNIDKLIMYDSYLEENLSLINLKKPSCDFITKVDVI